VIARSDDKRPVPKTYSAEECSIVWSAINTGAPQATGDVHSDAPKTGRGKSYQSILALPVRLKNQVLGAVSIDSEAAYHFEGFEDDLEVNLAPYVQLLAIVLAREVAKALPQDHDHATNSAGNGALSTGSEEKFDEPTT
jgi:hypothetical protein